MVSKDGNQFSSECKLTTRESGNSQLLPYFPGSQRLVNGFFFETMRMSIPDPARKNAGQKKGSGLNGTSILSANSVRVCVLS